MEGSIVNKLAEHTYIDDGSVPLTEQELWIANVLRSRLRSPLLWEYGADPIELEGGENPPYYYEPTFAIRNTETGRRLFVEINSVPGLSLPNLILLGLIGKTARRDGGDCLLFVEGKVDPRMERHLLSRQIHAVWLANRDDSTVMSAIEAALL